MDVLDAFLAVGRLHFSFRMLSLYPPEAIIQPYIRLHRLSMPRENFDEKKNNIYRRLDYYSLRSSLSGMLDTDTL
jgi:hypothetical protein